MVYEMKGRIYMDMFIGKFQVDATNILVWNADHMVTNH